MKPLRDLTVVEFAGSIAGAYCTKLFVDGGARVHVIGAGNLTSHQRRYLHRGTITSDRLHVDLATADVIIESSAPGALTPLAIEATDPIRVHLSPFGTSGPRAEWNGTDLIDYALGGHAYLYGDPDREPLRGPPDQPGVAAGLFGFVGAMAGLFARGRLGRGQTVDISHVQVMVALHQFTLLRWSMTGDVLRRMGNRYTGQGQPNGLYRCADGWVAITAVTDRQVEYLLAITELADLMEHPDIESPMDFQSHPEVLDRPLDKWLSDKSVAEVTELFQTMRIPAGPVRNMADLLDDPQLVDRRFFEPVDDASLEQVPGPPFTYADHQPRGDRAWIPGDLADGPLAGLRVLDLTRVWAGPLCTRILSDLGADVVTVEAPWARGPREVPDSMIEATRYFPDDVPGDRQWNRNGHIVKYALGKRSLALDLQTESGRQTLTRLIPDFHVLAENFTPRVMPQLGFDEHRLHELNPDLIYLTMPGFGRSGPAENWLAYGSCIDSHAGLSSLNGYRDHVPWKGGIAWPDPIAGLHAAAAVLSALWGGGASGDGGITIEAAQFESILAAIGDRVLEAQVDGVWVPDGNRDPGFVVQGIYRCAGDDEWIAISAPDAATWESLAKLTGLAPTAIDDHDQLDKMLGVFTARHEANELADRMQMAGIPAGAVHKASALLADHHLRARGAFVTVDQPDIGPFTAPHTPIGLSATPVDVRRPAPTLGEHNVEVLTEAGFSTAEITELATARVIATEPPE